MFFHEPPGDLADQQPQEEEHNGSHGGQFHRAHEIPVAEQAPAQHGKDRDKCQSRGELLCHGGFRGTDVVQVGPAALARRGPTICIGRRALESEANLAGRSDRIATTRLGI